MMKAVFRHIYNYKKQIKYYVLIQILAFFWICIYLEKGIYIEKFHILLTGRSMILLFGILAIVVLVGYLLLLQKIRIQIHEDTETFLHLGMLPMSLIMVFCSCCQNNIIVVILTISLAVYAVIVGIANAKKMLPKCVGRRKSYRYRLLYVNKMIKMISCVGLLTIVIFGVGDNVLPQKETVTSVNNIGKTVISKEELVRDFDEKNWRDLSEEKKLQYLQKLADYTTQKYLGCCTVTVRQALRLNKDIWGWFEDTIPEYVFVSGDRLEDSTACDLANTVLHEVYHHYQYECISAVNFNHTESDLHYFQKLKSWKENFEHYKEADQYGYEAYKDQSVEKDANEFADRTIKKIWGE